MTDRTAPPLLVEEIKTLLRWSAAWLREQHPEPDTYRLLREAVALLEQQREAIETLEQEKARAASVCEAVAQQLLATKYADMARESWENLPRAVEWLRADYDALARLQQEQKGWQPIATLPETYDKPFLVFWQKSLMGTPHADMVAGRREYDKIIGFGEPPASHWMPMPLPPVLRTSEEPTPSKEPR